MTIAIISQDDFHHQQQKSSPSLKCNLMMASQFLSALSEGESVTFQTFDDTMRKDRTLARIFHGTLEDHSEELIKLNQQGAGVFFTVNQTDGQGRQASNIIKVRAVFVDLDGTPLEPVLDAPIAPHIVVETSVGRYHAYWLVDGLPLEQFRAVQQSLATRFNADPKPIDLPRVMRLPGFFHQKQGPVQTRVLMTSGGLPIEVKEFIRDFGITLEKINKKEGDCNFGDLNPVLKALKSTKKLIRKDGSSTGRWLIECPWVHLHTTEGGEAHYFEPHTNGYAGHGFKCFHAHCNIRKGEDLLNWLGQTGNNSSPSNIEIWDDPTGLPEGLPSVASLESDMLPDALRGWLMDIADRMQIPPDFSSASAIVVLSSLIGRKVGILPKKQDNWLVVPNLWGAVVGRPSLMKSPAIAEVMKPLDRLITEALEKHSNALTEYSFQEMIINARKDAFDSNLKKAAKNNDKNLEKFIADNPQPAQAAKPMLKRYKTEDATIEKIGEILMENSNGILIHRDELTGWLKSLDKDGREGDRQFYLEAWNGTGSFTVDRIKRGTLHIPALRLSILGGIQPGPLSSYVYQCIKGGSGDDGLIQRFQLLVWPDCPKDWKNVDRLPDSEAKRRAYEIFKQLDSFLPISGAHDLDTDIPTLHFSPEAQDIADSWRATLEHRLRSGNMSPAIESHLAKYRSLMPTLSLIFQLCFDLDRFVKPKFIGKEAIDMAIRWCVYLESHACRLYSCAESPGMESARFLLHHLQKGDLSDGFTLRDVYLKHWSKLSNPEEVQRATDILIIHSWLRSEEIKTPGRPKHVFRIHPKIKIKEKNE